METWLLRTPCFFIAVTSVFNNFSSVLTLSAQPVVVWLFWFPCTSLTATWNFLISRARSMELAWWTQHKNILFLFPNSYAVFSDSTPENFANIQQIEWNWIRSIKFEIGRIHFPSDVFGLLSSRNFATMATWRNDFCLLALFLETNKPTSVTPTLNSPRKGRSEWKWCLLHWALVAGSLNDLIKA